MVKKMNGESVDLTKQNIERLKELFPEVLTDGEKIDFDMLKTVLGEVVEDNNERYQFTWHGKKQAILGAQKPSKGTLRPVPEKSKNFDTTENLYIEGDNLEVLKLLQKSYNGKVKMIYIDPPYNTGKDFVYKDNFKDGIKNYLEQTGQVDNEGNIISTNSESNGRFHTDWLNMMYARLRLARNLLTEDGVIFISIDDSEVGNLRKICDEIFGENNFISNVIWQKKFSRANDATYFSTMHDHILCYCKKHIKQNENGWKIGLLPRGDEIPTGYSNPDNDGRGVWTSVVLSAKSGSDKLLYPITTPSGRVCTPPSGRYWSVSRERFDELVRDNRIWFGINGDGVPRLKTFLSEVQDGLRPNSILFHQEVGHNQEGKQETKALFDDVGVFDGPKPVRLLSQLIRMANLKENDIVLDFFSGSATTAHAVMRYNADTKKNISFILVQLPEVCNEGSEAEKAGYQTICDIGEERIRRAGEKIKQELLEKQQSAGMSDENAVDPESLDIGFKVLKLDTSNIREWNTNLENLEGELDFFESPFIEGRSELDIVYEIMLKHGLELTYPINTFKVDGKNVYDIAFGNLFICLADNIDINIAKAIIAKRDEYGIETSSVVFSDAGFNGNDSEKLNCIELLKDAGYPEDNLLTI
ncbi:MULTISPECIES: site-specific DNA-methyltransferase [Bacillus]|uniref:site-specific DNA-methyltransferase n=1 Tax=Bacillus TaxID=1386 RepID=UPI000BF4A73C|nr:MULTISPECIES: site-specific DNA-methyltransferase [Bacillus]MED4306642.1 site-specific DNA-methyltransferase [Bacillus licheniformis]MED4373976.1 site-specific DNA-methyltransferase [Bacillus licheniformis]MED4549330.1 site-specific DNA-methyltransferase [Bacillus licheniformis]